MVKGGAFPFSFLLALLFKRNHKECIFEDEKQLS